MGSTKSPAKEDKNHHQKYPTDGINLKIQRLIEKSIREVFEKYGFFNKYRRTYTIAWHTISRHFKQRYYAGDKRAIFDLRDICTDFLRSSFFLKEEWVIDQLTVWIEESNKKDVNKLLWGEKRGKNREIMLSTRISKRYPIAKSINDLLNREVVKTLDEAYDHLAGIKISIGHKEAETVVLSKDGIRSAFLKFIVDGVRLPIFSFALWDCNHRHIIYDVSEFVQLIEVKGVLVRLSLFFHTWNNGMLEYWNNVKNKPCEYNLKTGRWNLVKDWQGFELLYYCILKADQEEVDHEEVEKLVQLVNELSPEKRNVLKMWGRYRDIYPDMDRLLDKFDELNDKERERLKEKIDHDVKIPPF